ncbi:MAG TPA: tetratricopeptide repeat protein [Nitrospira sp.]|nr:tetratricopeptide repeat protein [Nitrospira sp.]
MARHKHPSNAMEIDRLATQLAKDPQSKAFLPLAEEYCKVGMWEEAVSVLEQGLKYYPAFITAMVVLGRAYDQLNQPTKARAVLEGAIKLSPENLRAHRTLIRIYSAQGLKQEALASCRVILAMHPKDEEALSAQASLAAQEVEQSNLDSPVSTSPPVPQESHAASPVERAGASDVRSGDDERGFEGTSRELQCEAADKTNGASRDARTIAQLESWLRRLEQQRRDRPASETHSNL